MDDKTRIQIQALVDSAFTLGIVRGQVYTIHRETSIGTLSKVGAVCDQTIGITAAICDILDMESPF